MKNIRFSINTLGIVLFIGLRAGSIHAQDLHLEFNYFNAATEQQFVGDKVSGNLKSDLGHGQGASLSLTGPLIKDHFRLRTEMGLISSTQFMYQAFYRHQDQTTSLEGYWSALRLYLAINPEYALQAGNWEFSLSAGPLFSMEMDHRWHGSPEGDQDVRSKLLPGDNRSIRYNVQLGVSYAIRRMRIGLRGTYMNLGKSSIVNSSVFNPEMKSKAFTLGFTVSYAF